MGNAAGQGGKELLGIDDDDQLAADEAAHPWATTAAEMGVGVAGMAPVKGAQLGVRALGGGIQGAMEVGNQIYEGKFDPYAIARQVAAGAVLPATNKVGEALVHAGSKLGKMVPGRPNQPVNPAADQAKVDVGSQHVETTAAGGSTAQEPPVQRDGSSTGNPQSSPERSSRSYPKDNEGTPPENDMLTQGDMDPATAAALSGEVEGVSPDQATFADEGAPPPAQEPAPQQPDVPTTSTQPAPAQEPVSQPINAPNASGPQQENVSQPVQNGSGTEVGQVGQALAKHGFDPDAYLAQVETGFPKAGEPVAVGENEATPMPKRDAAIAISKANAGKPKSTLGQKPETITAAASKFGGKIYEGKTHGEAFQKYVSETGKHDAEAAKDYGGEGFVTNTGRYVDRIEAQKIMDRVSGNAPDRKTLAQQELHAEELPAVKGKTNPNPTEGQKEAGNYEKAREKVANREVAYENMKGDERTGKDANGVPWSHPVPADYGYFVGTRGADSVGKKKEGIDVYNLRNGDRHFIIDQENLDTGKFDEHKVMANAKDRGDAYNTYVKGFGDGKGGQRVHDITEVTADELDKWAGGHGKSTKKEYGAKFEKARVKPVQERAVVKDAIAKLEAKGEKEKADALRNAPEAETRAAIEGKRTRKYGVASGASAGYPIEGLLNSEGKPVTAKNKSLEKGGEKSAEWKGQRHKTVVDWFNKTAPKEGEETNGELLDRIKGLPPKHSWLPQHQPKEWMLMQAARRTLAEPTKGNIDTFRDAERFLRGGEAAVETYRSGNSTEAGIAMSKRGGDKAVESAEAGLAAREAGSNKVEDEAIARLDAETARKGAMVEDETEMPPKKIESAADLPKGVKDMDNPEHRAEVAAFFNKDVETPAWKEEANAKQQTVAEKMAAQRAAREAAAPAGADKTVPKIDPTAAARARREAALEREGNREEGEEPAKGFMDVADKFRKAPSGHGTIESMKALMKRTSSYLPKVTNQGKPPPPPAQPSAPTGPKASWWDSKRSLPKTYMPRDLEPGSIEEYQSELSDRLAQHDAEHTQHERRIEQHVNETKASIPAKRLEALNKAAYLAREEDALAQRLPGRGFHSLADLQANNPEAYKLYKERLEGMYNQNEAVADWIREHDPTAIGPKTGGLHVYRMLDDAANPLNDRAGRFKDPLSNPKPLSGRADTAKERDFFALERGDGRRYVIQPTANGYRVWEKGRIVQSIKDPTFKFNDGDQIKVGSQTLTMTDAMTREIMANVKTKDNKYLKYHVNATGSAAMANLQLTEQMHHMQLVRELMDDPRFKDWSTQDPKDPRVTSGEYIKTKLGEFNDNTKPYYMQPKMAHVFDDYAGDPLLGNARAVQAARNLSTGVMKTMFWNPIIHPLSVGSHFYPARGWDNYTVEGNKSLAVNMRKAFNSVVNYDGALDNRIASAGGSLMHPGTVTRDMRDTVFKAVGISMDKNPEAWDKVANKLGIASGSAIDKAGAAGSKLAKAIYDGSQNITWASNDVFYKTLFLEHVDKLRSSHPDATQSEIDRGAVRATEKDLPNYRVAPELMGRRGLSQTMHDRLVSGFGPFHVGVANAYANMIKPMIDYRDSSQYTPQDRLDAAGKLFALAIMGAVIAPLLDKGAKKLTGNPDSEVVRRSALAVPHEIYKATKGTADPQEAVRRLAMLSPGLSTAMQAYQNKDFGDRPIIQPGDFSNAAHGSWRAGARIAKGAGEFALGNAVQPAGQVLRELHKQNGGLGTGLGDAAGLYTNPSPSARKFMAEQPKKAQQNAVARYKKSDWLDKQIGFK